MDSTLPSIPAKRYFTIGEVGELCGVKPHVLRYWEQEFTQLRPIKRRGNRRYYQHHEVLMIRRIRDLLYDQGFTISGARNRLQEWVQTDKQLKKGIFEDDDLSDESTLSDPVAASTAQPVMLSPDFPGSDRQSSLLLNELMEIRALLHV